MAYKVLGQLACAATTAETVYTVPDGKSAVVSTLAICNRTASAVTYRIAVRPAGANLATSHYIAYDVGLPANAADYLTLGITMAATDVLTFYASAASLTASAFGDES